VGAVAAGNCAVVKPSEFAPRTAAVIEEILRDAFAEEHVTVVPGERAVAEALLQERFDHIFFTGSTAVGRRVMTAAARHLTPVTLELGGKCPCLVCADAPLQTTARRVAWGKFLNAGQTCVAPDFVLVDRAVGRDFLAALQQAVRAFYGDNPRQSADYGRLINRRHFERVTRFLSDGKIFMGGEHDVEDLYIAPTLLTETATHAPVMQEEIFGPVLPVVEFESLDEALDQLRGRPTPLALYLFTQSRAIQNRVLAETRSGGVCVNDVVMHMIGKDLPFGGLGESGFGVYHGRASFDCFTHWRSVLRRSLAVDPRLRYPPPRTGLSTLKQAFRFLLGG
jgi:acyl-CoA reductase-like NAD-dependent aldehyde dehydrogenase